MREEFQRELGRLDQDLVRLAALVEQAIERAVNALIECDVERAAQVKAGDQDVDDLYLEVEGRALRLLATEQPVAGDLRFIVAVILNLNDLERCGDLAYNVASMVRVDLPLARFKSLTTLVHELGAASNGLLGTAIDAWAAKDVALASRMDDLDDETDQLYKRLLAEIFRLKDEVTFEVAMDLVLVGRYLERIADHAVNIAERMAYSVTGGLEHLG